MSYLAFVLSDYKVDIEEIRINTVSSSDFVGDEWESLDNRYFKIELPQIIDLLLQ